MYNKIYSIWIKFIVVIIIILFMLFFTGKGCNKVNKKFEQSFNQGIEEWGKEQMMQDEESNSNDSKTEIYNNIPDQLIGLWNNVANKNKYIEINDESLIIIDKLDGTERINNVVNYKIKNDIIIADDLVQYKFDLSSDNTLTLEFEGINTIDYINKDILGTEGEYIFLKN